MTFYDSLFSCELQLGGGVRPEQRGPGNSLFPWELQLGGGVILHFYLDACTLTQLLMLMPVGMVRAVASERRKATAKGSDSRDLKIEKDIILLCSCPHLHCTLYT